MAKKNARDAFLSVLENYNISSFTLPTLNVEIKYRKLDIVDSSIKDTIPSFIASAVVDGMTQRLSGIETPEVDNPKIEKQDLHDLLVSSTNLLAQNIVEPQLKIDEIEQIPSSDRIAWFDYALTEAQQSVTEGGETLSADKVKDFPSPSKRRRNAKRSTNS